MNLRIIHKYSALVIVAFAFLHITNHLMSLINIQSHIVFMDIARKIYRQPIVEGLLLLCVVFQATSGLWLLIRGWRQRRGFVAWLQAISGSYLACFLLVHVGAVLYGRAILQLDTNFYFAAAGLLSASIVGVTAMVVLVSTADQPPCRVPTIAWSSANRLKLPERSASLCAGG